MPGRVVPVVTVRLQKQGARAHVDLTDKVTVLELEYEDNTQKSDKLKLKLDNFSLKHLDMPMFAPGDRVDVTWGYVGNPSEARRAIVRKLKGDHKTITIEADGEDSVMHKVVRSRGFDNMTPSEVALQIATEYGYSGAQLAIEKVDDRLRRAHISQAGQTDNALLKRLARDLGFDFYVSVDGFHFHKPLKGQAPRREFIYYRDPGQGDVLGFEFEGNLTGKPGIVAAVGINPITGKPIEAVGSKGDDALGDSLLITGRTGRQMLESVLANLPAAQREEALRNYDALTEGEPGAANMSPAEDPRDTALRAKEERLRNAWNLVHSESWARLVDGPPVAGGSGAVLTDIQREILGAVRKGLPLPAHVVRQLPMGLSDAAMLLLNTTADGDATAKAAVDGLKRQTSDVAMKLEVETIGDPRVHAGMLVKLTGFGAVLSGNAMVEAVKHKVSAKGGYTMKMTCKKDAIGAGLGPNAIAAGGRVNAQDVASENERTPGLNIDGRTGTQWCSEADLVGPPTPLGEPIASFEPNTQPAETLQSIAPNEPNSSQPP